MQLRRGPRSGGPSASHAKPSSSASGSARGMPKRATTSRERAVGGVRHAAGRRRSRCEPLAQPCSDRTAAAPSQIDRVVGEPAEGVERGRRLAHARGSSSDAAMEGARAVAQQRAARGAGRQRVANPDQAKDGCIRHHRVEHARGRQHAGQAGARDACRRRRDTGASTSSLRLCGRNQALCVSTGSMPNAAPRNDEQPVLEVLRRQQARRDDVRRSRPGSSVASGAAASALPVGLGRSRQSVPLPEMRHRRQHVERVAAGRRERRIGRGRPVQVEAEVVGEHLALEDVVQQLAIARARAGSCGARRRGTGARVPKYQTNRLIE